MNIEKRIKSSFSVIGKEGATSDGPGFIQKLWEEANVHFGQVQHLAKKDEKGNPVGFWGAMSDCSRSFKPWEDNFSKGLYLAGVECLDDAPPPEGWTKWTIPGYAYLCAEVESESTFPLCFITMPKPYTLALSVAVPEGESYMVVKADVPKSAKKSFSLPTCPSSSHIS